MDWHVFWEIIRDIVLPHLGRLILNIIVFLIVGILISIFLVVIFKKKNILSRKNRIYTLIIRTIYIPGIIIAGLVFCFQIGFIRGVYKIIKKENPQITNGIYMGTVGQLVATDKDKDAFVEEMKSLAYKAQQSNTEFTYALSNGISKQTKNAEINSFSAYVVKKYNEEVYSAVLFGFCYAADIKFDKKLNYSDFENVLDIIKKTDRVKVEKSIKFAMGMKLHKLFYKQYISAITSIIISWLLVLAIPLVEFLIYKLWIEKRCLSK